MRIVHTSDWHIGKTVGEFSMLEDQRYILNQLITFLKQQQAELLIVAGDLYDRSVPPAEAVSLLDDVLYRITTEAGVPVVAVSGNHDSPQRLSFASRLYEGAGLYLEGVYRKDIRRITLQDAYGRLNVYCLPYIEPALVRADFPGEKIHSYDDAFRAVIEHNLPRVDFSERNVLVTHGFFSYLREPQSVQRSDSEITLGGADLIDASYVRDFDYVALGHLHRPQTAGREHIRYSGAPLKYSVSESDACKSITTLELREKGQMSVKRYELSPLRDLRRLRGSFEELCAAAPTEDYVYAELTDDSLIPGAMERLRAVYPNILGLCLLCRERERSAVVNAAAAVKAKTPLALFEEFYGAIRGEPITEARSRLAAEILEQVRGGEEA